MKKHIKKLSKKLDQFNDLQIELKKYIKKNVNDRKAKKLVSKFLISSAEKFERLGQYVDDEIPNRKKESDAKREHRLEFQDLLTDNS